MEKIEIGIKYNYPDDIYGRTSKFTLIGFNLENHTLILKDEEGYIWEEEIKSMKNIMEKMN